MIRVLGRKLVDLSTGTLRNTLEHGTPFVHDDAVVCTVRDGTRLALIGVADARARWEADVPSKVAQMTLDGRDLFVATGDRLLALGIADGAIRELVRADVAGFSVCGDVVSARLHSGKIVLLSREGRVLGRVDPSPDERLANGKDFLLEGSGGVPAIALEALETRYFVRGVRSDGSIAWTQSVEHSELLSREKTSGTYFFLEFETATPHHLLFTSHWSTFRHPASVVLRVADGARVAEFEQHVSSLVEGAGGTLEGLLTVDAVKHQLVMREPGSEGRVRWTTRSPSDSHRRTDAALSPAGLAVVQYDATAPGARLVLLDPSSGLTRWEADVESRPPYERTPLFLNGWKVDIAGDRVVLIGDESPGTCAQIFDLEDGRRIFSDLAI